MLSLACCFFDRSDLKYMLPRCTDLQSRLMLHINVHVSVLLGQPCIALHRSLLSCRRRSRAVECLIQQMSASCWIRHSTVLLLLQLGRGLRSVIHLPHAGSGEQEPGPASHCRHRPLHEVLLKKDLKINTTGAFGHSWIGAPAVFTLRSFLRRTSWRGLCLMR